MSKIFISNPHLAENLPHSQILWCKFVLLKWSMRIQPQPQGL